MDLTKKEDIVRCFSEVQPDLVINAGAYTAVDKAEEDFELAKLINTEAPGMLASLCAGSNVRLIHVSTDFVFDGKKRDPYEPEDLTNPLGIYGLTKREGEKEISTKAPQHSLIIRTSWLWSNHGKNFVKTMLSLFEKHDQVRVVSDQVGSPTWAGGLANIIWRLSEKEKIRGSYHWADSGNCSWYDFAVAVRAKCHSNCQIEKILASEFPSKAKRPSFSVLSSSKLSKELGVSPVHWKLNLEKNLLIGAH